MLSAFARLQLDRALCRPGGLVAHASGLLLATDATGLGGVAVVDPAGGRVWRHLSRTTPLEPAALALEPGGSVLLADAAVRRGGVVRLHPGGEVEDVLVAVDGSPLPPAAGVVRCGSGLVLATVPTRRLARAEATRAGIADGFVAVLAGGVGRIAAEGLAFPTACVLSPDESFLYVAELIGRRISRCAIGPHGRLGSPEPVHSFGGGIFPSALAFDSAGGLLVASQVCATVLRIAPDGRRRIVCSASDAADVAAVEHAFSNLCPCAQALARDTGPLGATALAFGGAALGTLWFSRPSAEQLTGLELGLRGIAGPGFALDLGPLARLPAAFPLREIASSAA